MTTVVIKGYDIFLAKYQQQVPGLCKQVAWLIGRYLSIIALLFLSINYTALSTKIGLSVSLIFTGCLRVHKISSYMQLRWELLQGIWRYVEPRHFPTILLFSLFIFQICTHLVHVYVRVKTTVPSMSTLGTMFLQLCTKQQSGQTS